MPGAIGFRLPFLVGRAVPKSFAKLADGGAQLAAKPLDAANSENQRDDGEDCDQFWKTNVHCVESDLRGLGDLEGLD